MSIYICWGVLKNEDTYPEEFSEEVRNKALEFFEGLQIECKKTNPKVKSNYMATDQTRDFLLIKHT